MAKKLDTYKQLPRILRKEDSNLELRKVMNAIDKVLDDVTIDTLKTAWDIENADREELEIMANTLGLYPKPFMTDDVLKRYIRTSGDIRSMKGTDTLIQLLVDTLTRFKVYEVTLDANNQRRVNVKIVYGQYKDLEIQQRILDFLIDKYKRFIYEYVVTYLSMTKSVINPVFQPVIFTTIMRDNIITINFGNTDAQGVMEVKKPTVRARFYTIPEIVPVYDLKSGLYLRARTQSDITGDMVTARTTHASKIQTEKVITDTRLSSTKMRTTHVNGDELYFVSETFPEPFQLMTI